MIQLIDDLIIMNHKYALTKGIYYPFDTKIGMRVTPVMDI